MDKSKIFVVDDHDTLRYTIEKFLSREGYEVVTASDYDDALEKLTETNFDLMLADIMLGAKTGIDLLQEVKRRGLQCPVILITGFPNMETASDAVREGAYDYVLKPVRRDSLLLKVKKALEYKAVIDKNRKYQLNLDAIFRSVKDGIVTVDGQMNVLEANEAINGICGFLPGEIKGKSYNALPLKCNGSCLKFIEKTLKTEKPVELNYMKCEHHQRPYGFVDLSTYPLVNPDGNSYGCVLVLKDVSRLVSLENDLHKRKQFHNLIGSSREMQDIYSLIQNISNVNTTVLITGESGTGKELVAESIHFEGGRQNKPLIKVNCAALSDELLESELFGHVKGAFTGAITDRVGRFKKADGGTIFLDEIGDISEKLQTRLLRVLQESEFERVGDSNSIKVDVRVVAATNNDLGEKVKSGSFRQDLFYRLNVIRLKLPPLRDRLDDIPALVDHFLKMLNIKHNKNVVSISEDVQRVFMNYPWPGNVRELLNTLEFAFVLCQNHSIRVNSLPSEFLDRSKTVLEPPGNGTNERKEIIQLLKETDWNKAKTARLLGVDRTTIYAKIKKYNITEKRI
ncbi:MAG: response regulator [Candidatus Brocadiaceae bacterium]|nr:response regulator [Candidatus Brocadiaceae bacterium]